MPTNISKVIVISILCLIAISCAQLDKRKANTPPESKIVEDQLIAAAQSIERSLGLLAMVQEHNQPPVINTAPLITPEGGMGFTADIDWAGPIEPLLQKVAKITNYKVKTLGKEPSIPIIVSITQQQAIVADVLKNAALQAGKRASVLVFPASKIIELRYAS